MVNKMPPTSDMKKPPIIAAIIAACVLLSGCTTAPGAGPLADQPGAHQPGAGSETDASPSSGFTDPASCLIGTWKEDMEAFNAAMLDADLKMGGGTADRKWGGGSFLRFDDQNMFFNWTEDSTFEWTMMGETTRSVTNGSAFGDYVVDDGVISWSNWSTLSIESQIYENGALVRVENPETLGEFSIPSVFTCTESQLEVNLGSTQLALMRVYDRVEGFSPGG